MSIPVNKTALWCWIACVLLLVCTAPEAYAQQRLDGFDAIRIGMQSSAVTAYLENSDYFDYDETTDVSIVPSTQNLLITTNGLSFIDNAYFQFATDRLISIHLILNATAVDHYTVYTSLTQKYGEPTALTPDKITWESDAVTLSLERPLTVKYIDALHFAQLQKSIVEQNSTTKSAQQSFIELF